MAAPWMLPSQRRHALSRRANDHAICFSDAATPPCPLRADSTSSSTLSNSASSHRGAPRTDTRPAPRQRRRTPTPQTPMPHRATQTRRPPTRLARKPRRPHARSGVQHIPRPNATATHNRNAARPAKPTCAKAVSPPSTLAAHRLDITPDTRERQTRPVARPRRRRRSAVCQPRVPPHVPKLDVARAAHRDRS